MLNDCQKGRDSLLRRAALVSVFLAFCLGAPAVLVPLRIGTPAISPPLCLGGCESLQDGSEGAVFDRCSCRSERRGDIGDQLRVLVARYAELAMVTAPGFGQD